MLALRLATVTLVLGCAAASPALANPSARSQKAAAKREFKAVVKSTPGMRSVYRGALVRATEATARWALGGAAAAAGGVLITASNEPAAMAVGTAIVALPTAVAIMHPAHLARARSETVAAAVRAGTIDRHTAQRWENAALLDDHWRAR